MTVDGAPEGVLDSAGMFDAAFALGDQMRRAVDTARTTPLREIGPIANVVVLGMGGSGVAADIAAAIGGPRLRVPLVVSKDYEAPAFIGPDTLVIAASVSGNTEETLSATRAALDAGAAVIAVTKGGMLGDLVAEHGGVVHVIDPDIAQPRAGIGAVGLPPLVYLDRLGLLEDTDAMIDAAIAAVEARLVANRGDDSPARTLARRIERTQPIIYGGGRLGATAALRLKNQINENAKCPAYATAMPELCHNEICAFGQHGDVTRQVNTILYVRHDFEHPQITRRFDFVTEFAAEAVAEIFEVTASGDGDLAQLFDLIIFGDLVSLWMAVEAGVDPGPVPLLMVLKDRLAQPA